MKIFQPIVTGSFTVSGSVFLPSLVTSSTVVTNVVMYGTNGQLFTTASTAIGGGGGGSTTPGGSNGQIQYNNSNTFGGVSKLTFDGTNLVGTGSFTGSFTGQFNGSITTALTASHAVNFTVENTLTLDQTLTDYASIASTIVGSNNLYQQATGSYTSVFVKYTLSNGTNARAGTIFTVWNGSSIEFSETATNDIGLTNNLILSASLSGANILLQGRSLSGSWSVKTLTRMI
jgi:hypothetical protein